MHFLRIRKWFQAALVLAALVFFLSSGLAAKSQHEQGKHQTQADPAPADAGKTYVGSQTCEACHGDLYKGFMASPHFVTTKKTAVTPEAHGCEACHGPGSAHVEAGGDPTKIFNFKTARPDEISRRCLTCHEANLEQQQFMRSVHNQNGITCTNCHSVHHARKEYLLRVSQINLCFSCHAEQKADFMKPFHHPVLEGLVQCTDCHNPHGTWGLRQVRSTPDQDLVCLKCHSDKRGPFVFEHNAVRAEGCMTCHFPHGSTNPRMLLTARVNSLCLQCHAAPGGPHNQNTKSQTCILCHSQIHGSNLSDVFFK